MNTLENIIMTVAVFGSATAVIFIIAKYNYLIKKAIAENGGSSNSNSISPRYIDIGCIVISLGIGLGISSIFTYMDLPEDTMDLLIYGCILICGGVGLFVTHYIRRKLEAGQRK